jgi:hypothetical protein
MRVNLACTSIHTDTSPAARIMDTGVPHLEMLACLPLSQQQGFRTPFELRSGKAGHNNYAVFQQRHVPRTEADTDARGRRGPGASRPCKLAA